MAAMALTTPATEPITVHASASTRQPYATSSSFGGRIPAERSLRDFDQPKDELSNSTNAASGIHTPITRHGWRVTSWPSAANTRLPECMVVELVVAELDRVHERIAGRFGRAEPRARVREYLCGLVAGLERKNGWTLAEHAGEVSPDGMQRLLRRADWDVDGVRDDVRGGTPPPAEQPRPGLRAPDPDGIWSWSGWRRRRQYQARQCHCRRRGCALT